MNPLNCGSLEACQRLQAAGIVLKTDYKWSKTIYSDYELCNRDAHLHAIEIHSFPAPSMAEVWRELPVYFEVDQCFQPNLVKVADDSKGMMYSAFYSHIDNKRPVPACYQSSNPTDALIDLLIWVGQRKEEV